MKPYDIYRKPPKVYRRIAVVRNSKWTFVSIPGNSFASETKTQKFYVINEKFSLCQYNQNDPSRGTFYGLPGDYIASDINSNLTLVTAADYKRKFSKPFRTGSPAPANSDDFLREGPKNLNQINSNNNTTNPPNTGTAENARRTTTGPSY